MVFQNYNANINLFQVIVFEIAQRLAPGVGIPLQKRLKKHDESVFKLDFDHMKVKFDTLTVSDNQKCNHDPAVQLLTPFFRTDPRLYSKFFGQETYIHFVAQKTRMIRKLCIFNFFIKKVEIVI